MDQTTENIRQIKKTFRLFMNGVTSRSMREKGLEYRSELGNTFGVSLKKSLQEYDKSFNLVIRIMER